MLKPKNGDVKDTPKTKSLLNKLIVGDIKWREAKDRSDQVSQTSKKVNLKIENNEYNFLFF